MSPSVAADLSRDRLPASASLAVVHLAAILDHPVEKELISLVEQGLKAGRMWFSYGLDLTNTMQRQKEREDRGEEWGRCPSGRARMTASSGTSTSWEG